MDIKIDHEEKHIHINELYIDREEEFYKFWNDLKSKYLGYTMNICYHNNPVPDNLMQKINARVIDSCIEMRITLNDFIPFNDHELILVTKENFSEFAKLHDKVTFANLDFYWTSERIKKDLSHWCIYMHKENYILMSLWGDVPEFFAIETSNKAVGKSLISIALEYAFNSGKTEVLSMAQDDLPLEVEMLEEIGFKSCGRYIGYLAIVK